LKTVQEEESKEDPSLVKQLLSSACLTLRSYLQFHVLNFGFNLQKKAKRKKLKYMDFQKKDFTNDMALEPFKKNISALMKAFHEQVFSPVVKIVNTGGLVPILEILNKSHYMWIDNGITFTVLEILELISLSPFSHIPLTECELQSGRSGISLLLDCANEQEPNVTEAALRAIYNLFVPHSKAMTYMIPIRQTIFDHFRKNDGIRILLDNLKNYDDIININNVRRLCYLILTEISSDPNINQILKKLELADLITDIMKEKRGEEKDSSLKDSELKLLEKITGRESKTVKREAKDHTLVRLEKASIVANTHITYKRDELLQLIHEYLDSKGLSQTAECLLGEAKIKPGKPSSTPFDPKPLLDRIVVDYLRQQHRECEDPISVLPHFSLYHKHTCPKPGRSLKSPNCIAKRINQSRISRNPRDIGFDFHRKTRKFIYSKVRYSHSIINETEGFTAISYTPDGFKIFCPTEEGEIYVYDRHGEYLDHHKVSGLGPVRGIVFSTDNIIDPRLLVWGENDSYMYGIGNLNTPIFEVPHCFASVFSNGNDLIAASSYNYTKIYNVAHNEVIAELQDTEENETVACFSPYDDVVLTNACLWDYRRSSKPLHRFDRLSQVGVSTFNPNGLEVIINSEVWDLRTLKLLTTCPPLREAKVLKFSPDKQVMFVGYSNSESTLSDAPSNTYKIIDTSSYQLLSSHTVDKHVITDICMDPISNRFALLSTSPRNSVRIYEFGRSRGDAAYEDSLDEEFEEEDEEDEDIEDDDDDDDIFGDHPVFRDDDDEFMIDDEGDDEEGIIILGDDEDIVVLDDDEFMDEDDDEDEEYEEDEDDGEEEE